MTKLIDYNNGMSLDRNEGQLVTTNKRNCLTKLCFDSKVEGGQYTPVCKRQTV